MADSVPRLTILSRFLRWVVGYLAAVFQVHRVPKEDDARDLVLDVRSVAKLRKSASYDCSSLTRIDSSLVPTF